MKIAQETAEYIYNRQISDYPMYVDELESFIAFKINGGETPKHIKVNLDLIPVKECLPTNKEAMWCLEIVRINTCGERERDFAEYDDGRWLAVDGTGDIYKKVTHWSTIPGLTNAEE